MSYKSLEKCISDLDFKGELLKIKRKVDPNLEIASIHLNEFDKGGKAILFEKVKGSKYKVVSNLFGTLNRSHFIFRKKLQIVKDLIELKNIFLVVSRGNPFCKSTL